jgi:hypothetical protein
VRLHNNFHYILVKLLIRGFRDCISFKLIGDKMKVLRRFLRKIKLFTIVIFKGIEEGSKRRAEWYLKNRSYID